MIQSAQPYVATTIELPSGVSERLLIAPFAMPAPTLEQAEVRVDRAAIAA